MFGIATIFKLRRLSWLVHLESMPVDVLPGNSYFVKLNAMEALIKLQSLASAVQLKSQLSAQDHIQGGTQTCS